MNSKQKAITVWTYLSENAVSKRSAFKALGLEPCKNFCHACEEAFSADGAGEFDFCAYCPLLGKWHGKRDNNLEVCGECSSHYIAWATTDNERLKKEAAKLMLINIIEEWH